MQVLILFNQVSAQSTADDLDVLKQVISVEAALDELGHVSQRLPCSLDLASVRAAIASLSPDVVFNLVESLGGTDRMMPMATVLLDALNVPYTGSSSLALLTTSDKLSCKRRLAQGGLPTPAWLTDGSLEWQGIQHDRVRPGRAIIKAVGEHASLGLSADSLFDCSAVTDLELLDAIRMRSGQLSTPHFAEDFIDGREFNLSLLAGPGGPEVLPPAEIEFNDFGPQEPRIVGHAAKWIEESPAYRNTPRRFDFPASDRALLDELEALARGCWTEFDLHGWARVDFRVDADGQPWILEINVNPCLSPDAGFAAAVERAELTFAEVIERILADSVQGTRP